MDAGAVTVPDEPAPRQAVPRARPAVPVGYALEADDNADALTMGFQVARTPDGDLSLLEAAEGVRDALSVELDNVTITDGHVTAGELVAVALTAVPAFAAARLTATLTDEEQATVNDLLSRSWTRPHPRNPRPEEEPTTEEEATMPDDPTTTASSSRPAR